MEKFGSLLAGGNINQNQRELNERNLNSRTGDRTG
jgi:hypothetical protein